MSSTMKENKGVKTITMARLKDRETEQKIRNIRQELIATIEEIYRLSPEGDVEIRYKKGKRFFYTDTSSNQGILIKKGVPNLFERYSDREIGLKNAEEIAEEVVRDIFPREKIIEIIEDIKNTQREKTI